MANEKKVIILNKPFLGDWLNEEGRIGHEIIDFFLADENKKGEKKYYVNNNPWGQCPDKIWVGDSEKVNDYGLKKTEGEKYIAEYMVLASDAHALDDKTNDEVASTNKRSKPKSFHILYVIKLKAKIHRFDTGKGEDKGLKKGQEEIGTLIENNGIAYNGKLLNKIYGEDDSLYLTFEADPNFVYKVKEGETLLFEPEKYNFARNRGYIYEDTLEADYKKLSDIIKKQIDLANKKDNDGKLEKYQLTTLGEATIGKHHVEKTFLDLIGSTDKEQAFTNMLHALLNDNEIFKKFCNTFRKDGSDFANGEDFKIEREKKIKGGRMDISGEGKLQKVIIENKIFSGLNGKKKDKKISQLSTYYDWGSKDENGEELPLSPLCFITAPDARIAYIKAEMKEYDLTMAEKDIFHFIPYSKIVEFLEENEELLKLNELISLLFGQIVNAFRNWSYKSREDLYADLFLKATDRNNA